MFTLTVKEPGAKAASHPIPDGEKGLVVGRDAACDVVVQSKEVSRRHARFFLRDEKLHVEDLGSQNGVFVKGAKVLRPAAVAAGTEVEIGDVKVVVAGAPEQVGVGAGAVLRGKGRDIKLPARAVVGRGADCDVVLDDDSVSRRHAELSRDDRGLYVAKDLESANGTFVDGKRLGKEPVALRDGSKVRFGDVELTVFRPSATPRTPASRQKLLAGGLVAAILIVAVLIIVRPGHRQQDAGDALGDDSMALVEQAQASLEGERLDEAARLAQQAIDADPLSARARKVLAQAKLEQDAQKTLQDAASKASVGRDHDGLLILANVPQQSRFFARARIRAKELGQAILRAHSGACRNAASPQSAAEDCAQVLDVKCQTVAIDADPLLKALRAAEKSLSRRVAWTCPHALAPLFNDTGGGTPESTAQADEKALAALYADPLVRTGIAMYVKGDIAGAVRALTSSAVTRSRSAQTAREAVERIKVVDGRFREGQTALLANQLDRADQAWGDALHADAALLPAGAESFLGRQMRTTLARAHARSGDEKLAKFQYGSAYDEYTRGLAVDPRDPHLLDAVAGMEKVAEQLLGAAAPSCDQLAVAAHITRADPPSPAHEQAQKALRQCR